MHTGFLSGTRVLTSTGHVAIVELRVGDHVITRNMKTGSQEVQRVSRTHVLGDAHISSFDLANLSDTSSSWIKFAGGMQAFWVKDHGWVRAEDFGSSDHRIERLDGSTCIVWNAEVFLYKTNTPGIVWREEYEKSDRGWEVDMRSPELKFLNTSPALRDTSAGDEQFLWTTHHIEVEVNHNFYVMDGMLVHDSSGPGPAAS